MEARSERARVANASFARLGAPTRALSRCSIDKAPASELSRKLIKPGALLVGGGVRGGRDGWYTAGLRSYPDQTPVTVSPSPSWTWLSCHGSTLHAYFFFFLLPSASTLFFFVVVVVLEACQDKYTPGPCLVGKFLLYSRQATNDKSKHREEMVLPF